MIETVTIQRAICDKCGFEWNLHKVIPKKCGQCQSKKWNEDSVAQDLIHPIPSTQKPVTKEDKLSGLRDLMNKISPSGENPVKVIKTEEDWRFTKEKPQYHEDGNVYRTRALAPDFKRTQVVQVDELDHDLIIRILG